MLRAGCCCVVVVVVVAVVVTACKCGMQQVQDSGDKHLRGDDVRLPIPYELIHTLPIIAWRHKSAACSG